MTYFLPPPLSLSRLFLENLYSAVKESEVRGEHWGNVICMKTQDVTAGPVYFSARRNVSRPPPTLRFALVSRYNQPCLIKLYAVMPSRQTGKEREGDRQGEEGTSIELPERRILNASSANEVFQNRATKPKHPRSAGLCVRGGWQERGRERGFDAEPFRHFDRLLAEIRAGLIIK